MKLGAQKGENEPIETENVSKSDEKMEVDNDATSKQAKSDTEDDGLYELISTIVFKIPSVDEFIKQLRNSDEQFVYSDPVHGPGMQWLLKSKLYFESNLL
jgi:hypothetical protein